MPDSPVAPLTLAAARVPWSVDPITSRDAFAAVALPNAALSLATFSGDCNVTPPVGSQPTSLDSDGDASGVAGSRPSVRVLCASLRAV
jgi:hypothetical protein